ncbi:putative ToxD-like zinc binding oxidoreductase [Elsinoe ampelina]|uniref:Putative ToxD-like zinc binding oxidoreductase n=1 Tax=Elsinoe ampelina TaxID=302913 RepID=A0A6A6GKZ4_9PEZI|nr:putative ToxD-like zinc binding oxidoreductase [Elsinoe ampelina]
MSAPNTMKAVTANRPLLSRIYNLATHTSPPLGAQVTTIPTPTLAPNQVLVRVTAVALNPTDHKHIDILSPRGSIIGCDYAGTVACVGTAATHLWTVGDRIAGTVHGGLYPDTGSFAEYLKVDADVAWRPPPGMSDEVAATYGVSATTAMLALNVTLGMPWPGAREGGGEERVLLVYSGATAAGLATIGLGKALGLTVVATASERSFGVVKGYGADEVVDYRSAGAVEEIKKKYPDVAFAVDCYSEGGSTDFCVEVIEILAYTLMGKEFAWLPPIGPKYGVKEGHRDALVHYYKHLPEWLDVLKPLPTKSVGQGFDGILKGLDMLRKGEVSGAKLVVKM